MDLHKFLKYFNMNNIELERQLIEAGFETTRYSNGFVSFRYEIPVGRFSGQIVEIALDAPNFPLIPPSGPYIKPFILPINANGGQHPLCGIHDRSIPTAEFQYWSRPCIVWQDCKRKDIKTYIAFLRSLFDFE